MKYDIRKLTLAADNLLPTLTNPRHRAIIANYRRHAIYEVTGNYEKILSPDMSIAEPQYYLHGGGGTMYLDGMKKVKALYASLVQENICVMMLEDEQLWVDDWGFASMATYQTFVPAAWALHKGADVDDLDATYIQTTQQSMMWPYDENCLMIGERVWIGGATFRKCSPEEVITREEAEDILMPLADRIPEPV